jgi:uncharacterized protein YyaL (SSP411 family)
MTVNHNLLHYETGTFLKSHSHQPVEWYPWCDAAFDRARSENKLIFLSIGFHACHWCHEQSRNCFENPDIARKLNEDFVCVKVDREERPDIDLFYGTVVEMINGQGGWPVSCFITSEGLPVYGGTYYEPEYFLGVILELSWTYRHERQRLVEAGMELVASLKSDNCTEQKPIKPFSSDDARLIVESWRRKFDCENGGTSGSPKFPLPISLAFLLCSGYYLNDASLVRFVEFSVANISRGGIYDHLGGGFFRCSHDTTWNKPRFEKMLYDNAMLLMIYSGCHQQNPHPLYRETVEETIAFLNDAFLTDNHLYSSSISAESDELDGQYYTWCSDELKRILGDRYPLAADYFGVIDGETRNVLFINTDIEILARKYSLSTRECRAEIDLIKKRLLDARKKRKPPLTDDKIISGWNTLVISAYCEVYMSFGTLSVLEQSERMAAEIAETYILPDYQMLRIASNATPACLDDYSFTINAFLRLYRITGKKYYIDMAKGMIEYTLSNFYDPKSGMFFFSADPIRPQLPRMRDLVDRAIPSSNALMAKALTLISLIEGNDCYSNIVVRMLNNIRDQMPAAGPYVAYWGQVLYNYIYKPKLEIFEYDILPVVESFTPDILYLPV